jgi:single-strand DNA-binding protein
MNSITIAGSLGKDAEIRYLPNGDPVAAFSVADSQGRDKPTIWWSCSLFGKRAESLAPYLLKGQAVTVTGNVTEREYEKDGQKRKAMDVRVSDVALQGGKREAQAGGNY